MILHRVASFPHGSTHGAALPARADDAVADDADVRNPVSVVERVNAYGVDADVVTALRPVVLSVYVHGASARPQSTEVIAWQL